MLNRTAPHGISGVTMDNLILDQDYKQWLISLKGKVRNSQFKAAVQVNETLLRLYWDMGREITDRQKNTRWGSGFLLQLSKDLHTAFPDMKGFSLRNLKYIRLFYQFYEKNSSAPQDPFQSGQQPVAQLPDAIFKIPWGHHVVLMSKCKSLHEALFYVQKTIDGNWSRLLPDEVKSSLPAIEEIEYELSEKIDKNNDGK